MKKNKGVSLITLVITIVILIIIAGVTVYYGGIKNIQHADNVGAYTEAQNVSEAVISRAFFNKTNSTRYPYIGTALTNETPEEINGIEYGDNWYKLTPEESTKLELENVARTYIINYLTGEVVSTTPILIDDEEYFTLSDLKEVMEKENPELSGEQYNIVKGVNKPALINGMIPVRNINGKWIVVNAEDENWYDYSSEKKMWANIMLTDELEVEGYTNEELRKTALVNLEGREVTKNGSTFVWIPRYSIDPAGNIIFSKSYTDYTQNGYTVSPAFKENGNLTGIWISKYDVEITQ